MSAVRPIGQALESDGLASLVVLLQVLAEVLPLEPRRDIRLVGDPVVGVVDDHPVIRLSDSDQLFSFRLYWLFHSTCHPSFMFTHLFLLPGITQPLTLGAFSSTFTLPFGGTFVL